MNKLIGKFVGVKLTYQGNVLYSSAKKTADENFEQAKIALGKLLDIDPEMLFSGEPSMFEDQGGKVELFSSH